jgi:hypothetical protein
MLDISKIVYPIKKEQLQMFFNLRKELIEKEKKDKIDKYIKEKIDHISSLIINNTINEFEYNELISTTKVVYDYIEDEDTGETVEESKRIVSKTENEIKIIKDKIKNRQQVIYKFESDYNRQLPDKTKRQQVNYKFENDPNGQLPDESVKMSIMNALIERFPDCSIQIDPIKTYLFIDWN